MLLLSFSSKGATLSEVLPHLPGIPSRVKPQMPATAYLLTTFSVTCFLASPNSLPLSLLVLSRSPSQINICTPAPISRSALGEPNIRQLTADTVREVIPLVRAHRSKL